MKNFTHIAMVVTLSLFTLCTCQTDTTLSDGFEMDRFGSEFETTYRIEGQMLTGTEEYKGVLRMPVGPILKLLKTVGILERLQSEAVIERILVGARDFRSPPRFGLSRSDSCILISLRRGLQTDSNWIERASETPLEDSEGGPPWRYYVKYLDTRKVLACSSEQTHQRMASLLSARPTGVPKDLLMAGSSVDRVLSVRRFRTKGVVDPTAAGLMISPAYRVGPELESITVTVGETKIDLELVAYGEQARIAKLLESRFGIPIHVRTNGMLSGTAKLTSIRLEQLLSLMSLLGFTLYL